MIVYREITFKQAMEEVANGNSKGLFVADSTDLRHVSRFDFDLSKLERETFFIQETQEETEAHFTNERMREYANLKPEGSS